MSSATSDIVKASFLGVISIVAIIGNVTVCYALIKRRNTLLRNRPTYQFILNLTFSDLVIGLLLSPFEITKEILGSWVLGKALCKSVEYVEISTSGTAVITHALIALDRYRSIAHPHLPKLKAKLVKLLIALSWIVPAIISTPFLFMLNVVSIDVQRVCTPLAIPIPWLDKFYEAVEFTVMFFSPLCVICWCYYHVISITTGRTAGRARIPTAEIALRRSQKRVTKTACLIVVAFVICWSPTFVLSVWRIAAGTGSVHNGYLLYEIALFGGLVNEATNPIIYTVYDRNMKIWDYIRCGNRVSNNNNSEQDSNSRSLELNRCSRRNTTLQLHFVESHLIHN